MEKNNFAIKLFTAVDNGAGSTLVSLHNVGHFLPSLLFAGFTLLLAHKY
jgi:hypothetical protein